ESVRTWCPRLFKMRNGSHVSGFCQAADGHGADRIGSHRHRTHQALCTDRRRQDQDREGRLSHTRQLREPGSSDERGGGLMASSYKRFYRDGWGTELSKKGPAGKQSPFKNTKRNSQFTTLPKRSSTALGVSRHYEPI